jgi:hypothetical protein
MQEERSLSISLQRFPKIRQARFKNKSRHIPVTSLGIILMTPFVFIYSGLILLVF